MGLEGPYLDAPAQAAWRAYVGSHARLVAELNRRLIAVAGLTIADYEVLVRLSEAAGSRLRSFEVAEAMQWERSRLSHQLARMEQRGLVVRQPCLEDRRGSQVSLTPTGRRVLRRAAPHHAADVYELFVLPAGDDLAVIGRIGHRIDDTLQNTE